MSVIDVSEITFNGEEIRSLSEAIYEKVFNKPAYSEFHTIVPGIEAKKQIALLGRLGLIGKKGTGCNPTSGSFNIPMSEKFWNPEEVEVRLEQCYKDLQESFFVYGQQKGIARPDLTASDFMNFIEDRMNDALEEAVYRIAWFNDTDADLVTASPAGKLTAGTDKTFFNIIDGFWKQIFTIVTADSSKRYTITENAAGSHSAQDNLASDAALKALRALYQNADKRLKGDPNKVFVITDSLYDNLETYLESQQVSSSFDRIEAGSNGLRYRGVPIIKFDFWDRYIRAYFDNGTTYHLPHRAVLTTKENLQIGVESTDSLSKLDIFYDKKSKLNFVDSLFKIDSKVVEDYMVQVAY
jgi:hypothetical protein